MMLLEIVCVELKKIKLFYLETKINESSFFWI